MYIKEEVNNTLIIEKSRFISYLKPCFNDDEYKQFIKEIKKKHYDASHVCSGFISDNIKRSNDDGEPQGTAGIPILNVLEKSRLNHTAALVVRYFGGIKLGASGLARAYGNAVSLALDKASFVEDILYSKYKITLSYELANKIDYIVSKEGLNVNKEYNENVTYYYLTNEESLNNRIVELTSGLKPILIGNEIIQKDV